MNKVFNWARIAVAATFIAGAIAFGAMEIAKHYINLNNYRNRITSEIARTSGIQVGFERLEWLPYRPGIAAILPTIGKNIRANRLEAVVWLPSLLFGPPRLSRLSIDGLVVNVERDQEGRWNLAHLFTGQEKGGSLPAPPDNTIITNGSVTLSDAYAPLHATVIDEPHQTNYDYRAAKNYYLAEDTEQSLMPPITPAEPVDPATLFPLESDTGKPPADKQLAAKLLMLEGIDLHFHVGRWLFPTLIQFKAGLIDPSLKKNPLYRNLKPGTIELSLKSRFGAPAWDWNNSLTKGTINVDSIYSGSFDAYFSNLLPEHYSRKIYSFKLKFDGRPSKEMPFSGSLSARSVDHVINPELFTGSTHEPRRFNFAGAIRPNVISLDHFEIYLPGARLDVGMQIANYLKPDPNITLRASTSFVQLDKLDLLVPPTYLANPVVSAIRKSVGGGRFRVSGLTFNGPFSAFMHIAKPENLERVSGRLELEDASFLIRGMKLPVQGIKGIIDIKGNLVSFQNLSAVHGKSAITKLRGSISGLGTTPVLDAVMTANVDVAELREKALSRIVSKNLEDMIAPVRDIKGTVSATVNVQAGLLEQKITKLDADILFSNVGFRHDQFKVPVSGFNGTFHVTPTIVEIKDASFNVEDSAITVNGEVRRYAEPDYDMNMKIDIVGGIPRLSDNPLLAARLREGFTGNIMGNIDLSGTLDHLAFSQEFNLTQANVKFLGIIDKPPSHKLNISAKGTLQGGKRLVINEGRVDFGNSRIRFHGLAPDAHSWKGYDFRADVDDIDLADGPAYIQGFGAGMIKGAVKGEVHITDGGKKPVASGTLKAKIDDINLGQLERFKETLPVLGYLKLEGNVKGDVLARFSPGDMPKVNGWLSGKNVGFYTILPKKFQNIRGTIKLKGNLVSFNGIPFTSGNSSGTATGSLLIQKKPVLRLDVRASRLELGDTVWLEGAPDPWWTEKTKFSPELFIKARSNSGTLDIIPYKDIDLEMHYYHDRFTFKKIHFGAYQGSCDATGDINVEPDKPLFSTKMKLTAVEMEPLIKDVWPNIKKITGRMNLDGAFNGEGLEWKDLRHTLNGTARFKAADGLISQIGGWADFFSVINISPLLEKRATRQEGEGLPYSSIAGTMEIKKGTGHTDDLLLEGNVIRMSASGDIHFSDGTVKLLLGVKPFTSIDTIISHIPVAGTLLTGDQKSLVISYYDVTGPMDAPEIKAVPGESVARAILGIFQRMLEAPARALSTEKGLENLKEKKSEKTPAKN